MTEQNPDTAVDGINTDNQEDFDAEFYGTGKPPAESDVNNTEEDDDTNSETELENDSEEQSDDTDDIDADDDTADDDSSATDEDVSNEKPKGKKKQTVQERINELTAARREAERRAEELERRLAEQQNKSQDNTSKEDETSTTTTTEASAPNPDDREKYPLGDLDPQYQQDIMDYKLDARLKELDAKREQEIREAAERQRTEALQAEWTAKIEEAENTYENYRETVETLDSTFEGIDPEYGQFLAQTVMSMDKGPDILYHLAQNPDEASAIVKGNPVNAALALGRLEARFANVDRKPAPAKRTTKAPRPPASVNKGNAPRFSVKPDTDDLDAFSDVFYTR